jgi:hypothetical protein
LKRLVWKLRRLDIRSIRILFGMTPERPEHRKEQTWETRLMPDGSKEIWTTGPGARRTGRITYPGKESGT